MTSNIPKGDFISNTSSFNVNNEGFSDLRNSLGVSSQMFFYFILE